MKVTKFEVRKIEYHCEIKTIKSMRNYGNVLSKSIKKFDINLSKLVQSLFCQVTRSHPTMLASSLCQASR